MNKNQTLIIHDENSKKKKRITSQMKGKPTNMAKKKKTNHKNLFNCNCVFCVNGQQHRGWHLNDVGMEVRFKVYSRTQKGCSTTRYTATTSGS